MKEYCNFCERWFSTEAPHGHLFPPRYPSSLKQNQRKLLRALQVVEEAARWLDLAEWYCQAAK